MSYSTEEIVAPSFSIDQGGITVVRKIRLHNWSDVDGYITDLFAGGAATGGEPFRSSIATYPGRDALLLRGVRIEPFEPDRVDTDDSYGVATCDSGALITLNYSTVSFNMNPDEQDPSDPTTWLSWDTDVQQQILTHGQSGMKWESDDTQVPNDILPGFPVTIVNHTLTWHRVPDPPLDHWYDYVGKCNSSSFLDHDTEQVLFSGFTKSTQSNTDGTRSSEVRMTFQARIVHGTLETGAGSVIGWNHFLRPNGKWDRIVTKNDDKPIKTADLSEIFEYT